MDDPYIRTKWNKCKKDLTEEFNMVKQIDAERQAFREAPGKAPHLGIKRLMFEAETTFICTGNSFCQRMRSGPHIFAQ